MSPQAIHEQAKNDERCIRLSARLRRFRELQQIHMPEASAVIEAEEEQRDPDASPTPVELVKLWVPSELVEQNLTGGACSAALVRMEERVRDAQCREALRSLRRKLYAKSHLIHFRNIHVTGQRDCGRARGQIEELGIKIELVADK